MAEKTEKGAEKDLEKALDESLLDLAKAASGEEAEEAKGDEKKDEGEDAKGGKPDFFKKKGDKDKKDGEDEDKKPEGEDAKGGAEGEEAKGDEKKKEDEDEGEDEKSMRDGHATAAADTLAKSESVANAIEVSKFLREIVKSLAQINGDLSYRIRRLEKSNAALGAALVKSQGAQADIIKSFGAEIATMGRAPQPRKGVDGQAAKALEKSFRGDDAAAGETTLTKSQIADRLCELEIARKIPLGTTTKFESTGELHKSFAAMVQEKQ